MNKTRDETTDRGNEINDPVVEAKEEVVVEEVAPVEPVVEEKTEVPEEKKPRIDARMPVTRHKEILEKERAVRVAIETELSKLKQSTSVADVNKEITENESKLLTLETEYSGLLIDGNAKEAALKMAEIRRIERGIIESKNLFQTQAAEARAYERVRYDTMVERLEEAYPELNPDHADFNEALTKDVVELRDGFIATGRYSRADAIQKAAKTLLNASSVRQTKAIESDVRVSKDDVAKKIAEDRAIAARKKASGAAGTQPADINKIGLDSDKLGGTLDAKAVLAMSQTEFSKLDQKTLARMRGDEL